MPNLSTAARVSPPPAMENALEAAIAYTKERKQFGKSIADFPIKAGNFRD